MRCSKYDDSQVHAEIEDLEELWLWEGENDDSTQLGERDTTQDLQNANTRLHAASSGSWSSVIKVQFNIQGRKPIADPVYILTEPSPWARAVYAYWATPMSQSSVYTYWATPMSQSSVYTYWATHMSQSIKCTQHSGPLNRHGKCPGNVWTELHSYASSLH